jgi:predicted RNA-binding protein with PUA-like domain
VTGTVAYWLLKSEPEVFGVHDLKARPGKTERWDGVRNYQARNFLRVMNKGDLALFYHSSCAEPGVYGIVEIVRAAYPDVTAFDPKNEYYDPKSAPDSPRWFMVDVRLKRAFGQPVLLEHIRRTPALRNMPLAQRGNRLSVMPITASEWKTILKLAGEKPT